MKLKKIGWTARRGSRAGPGEQLHVVGQRARQPRGAWVGKADRDHRPRLTGTTRGSGRASQTTGLEDPLRFPRYKLPMRMGDL